MTLKNTKMKKANTNLSTNGSEKDLSLSIMISFFNIEVFYNTLKEETKKI